MSETDPIVLQLRHRNRDGAGRSREEQMVSFDRTELDLILRLYGLQVGAGEWRDYAIDMLKEKRRKAVRGRRSVLHFPPYGAAMCRFTVLRKTPNWRGAEGAYSVVAPGGQILKRGRDLEMVLRILQPKPKLAMI